MCVCARSALVPGGPRKEGAVEFAPHRRHGARVGQSQVPHLAQIILLELAGGLGDWCVDCMSCGNGCVMHKSLGAPRLGCGYTYGCGEGAGS